MGWTSPPIQLTAPDSSTFNLSSPPAVDGFTSYIDSGANSGKLPVDTSIVGPRSYNSHITGRGASHKCDLTLAKHPKMRQRRKPRQRVLGRSFKFDVSTSDQGMDYEEQAIVSNR